MTVVTIFLGDVLSFLPPFSANLAAAHDNIYHQNALWIEIEWNKEGSSRFNSSKVKNDLKVRLKKEIALINSKVSECLCFKVTVC